MNSPADFEPHHCGISVPDLKSSIGWYCSMLGFAVSRYIEIEGAKIVFLRHGDFFIELFEVSGASGMPDNRRYPGLDIRTHGTKHVAFKVKDLTKFMGTLKQRGVDVAMDVFSVQDIKAAFIRDNAGVLLEFVEENWT